MTARLDERIRTAEREGDLLLALRLHEQNGNALLPLRLVKLDGTVRYAHEMPNEELAEWVRCKIRRYVFLTFFSLDTRGYSVYENEISWDRFFPDPAMSEWPYEFFFFYQTCAPLLDEAVRRGALSYDDAYEFFRMRLYGACEDCSRRKRDPLTPDRNDPPLVRVKRPSLRFQCSRCQIDWELRCGKCDRPQRKEGYVSLSLPNHRHTGFYRVLCPRLSCRGILTCRGVLAWMRKKLTVTERLKRERRARVGAFRGGAGSGRDGRCPLCRKPVPLGGKCAACGKHAR